MVQIMCGLWNRVLKGHNTDSTMAQTEQCLKDAVCSICAETKVPVEMCECSRQEDKKICEDCAVQMYSGCSHPSCVCFGFSCPFCRKLDKSKKLWMASSAAYWEKRCNMAADKLLQHRSSDTHSVF